MRPTNRSTRRLRCLVGVYAGQLVDYPEHIAKLMLAWGTAADPHPVRERPEAEVATLPAPVGVG